MLYERTPTFLKTDFEKWEFDDCVECYEEYKEETNFIGIDCSCIQQLDIDDKTGTFKGSPTEAFYTKGPYFLSLTKKMPHIFMRTDFKGQHCAEIPFEHDILTNVWTFAHVNQEVINDEEDIPVFEFTSKNTNKNLQKSPTNTTQSVITIVPKECNTTMDPFKKAILDNIDPEKYHKYPEWSKFIWAIKFTFGDLALEIAVAKSKPLDNFVSSIDVKIYGCCN